MPSSKVGVVIGRFQLAELHVGHISLLMETARRHKDVLILLGCTRAENSKKNPLDYETRRKMMLHLSKDFKVQPLWNMPSDKDWTKQVDNIVKKVYKNKKGILYGSRDNCLKHYSGKMKKVRITPVSDAKATDARKSIKSVDDPKFRAGVIHHANTALPTSFQTVDAVIVETMNTDITRLLVGRKATDPKDKWRFIGGFVDPKDTSLERAVYRETIEEIGKDATIEIGRYLGSLQVKDWRYKDESSKIMTAAFLVYYQWGDIKASDDIQQLRWIPVNKMEPDRLVKSHQPIYEMFEDALIDIEQDMTSGPMVHRSFGALARQEARQEGRK